MNTISGFNLTLEWTPCVGSRSRIRRDDWVSQECGFALRAEPHAIWSDVPVNHAILMQLLHAAGELQNPLCDIERRC